MMPSMDVLIETPTPAGVAQALDVARRWLPAFLAGERAPEELYADRTVTWHNIGEREVEVQRTPSRTRSNAAGADLSVTEAIPVCLVVTLRDGLIARFEEYADSRAAEALLAQG